MPRFDLNLLGALDALLTERNVTRAAERLHVTQPTMSGMLQRLRDQFGDQLLVRSGRQLELTPLAASLSTPVREALLRVQAVVETAPVFDPATGARTFRLMTSDYCTSTFLPQVIRRLAAEAPHVRLEVCAMQAPLDSLISGSTDICITTDDLTLVDNEDCSDILQSEVLFSDGFTCIVDRGHPLRAPVTVEEYFAYPHVGVRMGGELVTLEDAALRQERPRYKPNYAVPNFMAIPYLVAGSHLIGVVQTRLAELLLKNLPLRTFEPPFPIPPINEALLWHARNTQDPAHRWLRQILTEEARRPQLRSVA